MAGGFSSLLRAICRIQGIAMPRLEKLTPSKYHFLQRCPSKLCRFPIECRHVFGNLLHSLHTLTPTVWTANGVYRRCLVGGAPLLIDLTHIFHTVYGHSAESNFLRTITVRKKAIVAYTDKTRRYGMLQKSSYKAHYRQNHLLFTIVVSAITIRERNGFAVHALDSPVGYGDTLV